MIAEFDSVGRFRKERSQAALSLAERKGHQIFAFELEEVEGEIDQTGAPALGGLLHKLQRCHAIRTNTAKFAVEIGGFHFELRESGGCRGIFGGPVEARAGEELDGAVLDPRRHAIAVEFDFVDS